MNNSLGSIYFYIVILFIIIFMFAITFTNSLYYSDIYDKGSENLSKSESQQIMYFNIVTSVLLFISLIMVAYMMVQSSVSDEKIKLLNEDIANKRLIVEEKEDEFKDEIIKEKTKKKMVKLLEMMQEPIEKANKQKNMVDEKNKTLSHEIDELNAKIEDIELDNKKLRNINDKLSNNYKSLYETDKDYLLKIQIKDSKNNKNSLFGEELTSDKNFTDKTVFESFDKESKMSVPSLFSENASFSEVLKRIPLTSVYNKNKEDKKYDYNISIPREKPLVEPYKISIPSIQNNNKMNGYKSYLNSFLKK